MKITDSDIRHTADDVEEKEVDQFFDIELQATHENGQLSNGTTHVIGDTHTPTDRSKENSAYVADVERNGVSTVRL